MATELEQSAEHATPEAQAFLRNLVADLEREPYLQKLTVGRGIVTEWRGRGDSDQPVTEFSVVIWPTAEVFKIVIWALEDRDWVVRHEGDGLTYGELLDIITRHMEGKL